MIARYSRPQMAEIWTDKHRYLAWLQVEYAVCEELAARGRIPRKEWVPLKKKLQKLLAEGGVDPKRVDAHEAVTRHDVIAFTAAVAEKVGPEARFVHFGLTSSDVVDTALSLLIQESGLILLRDVTQLLKTLRRLAGKYRSTPTIGRSHGMFAEPTSFGLKFLGWYCEWQRNQMRLSRALEGLRVGKLSGAVGVNTHLEPEFEKKVLARLELKREEVSTQVLPRDRHAELMSVFAVCGSSLERMALELRHLQRSEVGEAREGFQKGQKGSSAMPHKRNPISSENITGCARLLRAYAQAALENIPLWHERDISHSSVERVSLPDSTLLLDYSLVRMTTVLDQLVVDKARIKLNLEKAGSIVFSGHYLLALVEAGATREEAYQWVQECALRTLDSSESRGDFVQLLCEHPEVLRRLGEKTIRALGSLKHQLRNVDEIYRQAMK